MGCVSWPFRHGYCPNRPKILWVIPAPHDYARLTGVMHIRPHREFGVAMCEHKAGGRCHYCGDLALIDWQADSMTWRTYDEMTEEEAWEKVREAATSGDLTPSAARQGAGLTRSARRSRPTRTEE